LFVNIKKYVNFAIVIKIYNLKTFITWENKFFNFLASVALVALTYQAADAATLVTSDDCIGVSEYKELALNQKSKKTKTRKTSTHTQTRKVELPSSWERGIMMGGRYEYCFTSMEIGSASMDISLYKNGIDITVIPVSFNELSDTTLPASSKLIVGEDVFVVKNSIENTGTNEYTLEITDTATVNKIISSIATGNCIIKV